MANFPAVADNITVPAVAEPIGATLLLALLIANAVIVFTYNILPEFADAVGNVTVQVAEVLKMIDNAVDATVYVDVVTVIGAMGMTAFSESNSARAFCTVVDAILPVGTTDTVPADASPICKVDTVTTSILLVPANGAVSNINDVPVTE